MLSLRDMGATSPEIEEQLRRARLTPRELDVVHLKLRSYSHAQVARELGITEGTVKQLFHRARARMKSTESAG
jgi:DNA-binding CsgD family transcriptional regulator